MSFLGNGVVLILLLVFSSVAAFLPSTTTRRALTSSSFLRSSEQGDEPEQQPRSKYDLNVPKTGQASARGAGRGGGVFPLENKMKRVGA